MSLCSTTGFLQARDYLERAVSLDPNFASAYAGLAMTYTQLGFEAGMPRDKAAQAAKQAAAQALALNSNSSEAHAASAYARFLFEWDWSGPDSEFRRAVELNPNNADAHLFYSIYLTLCGRFDDAIRENQLAISLDPLNPIVNFNLGWTYALARRPAQGIEFMRKLQERNPNYPAAHHHLAYLYAVEGDCDLSNAEAEHSESYDSAFNYTLCGKPERALKLLHDAERDARQGTLDPIYPAWMNASLGRRDEAFAWLNRALDERSVQVVLLKVTPEFDSIRSDPRFAEALRRAMGGK